MCIRDSPYTPPSMQHFFAIYIKLQELTYTFQHFHGCKNHSGLPQIFSDLKSYMSPEEQEQMETVENIMNMMTLMQSMPDSAEPDLSDLFSSMFAQETKTEGKKMEAVSYTHLHKSALSPVFPTLFAIFPAVF